MIDRADGATAYRVDDTFEDAEKAYHEVMGRTETPTADKAPAVEAEAKETPEPVAKAKDAPVETERTDGRNPDGTFKSKDKSSDPTSPDQKKAGVEAVKTPSADEAPALSPDKAPPSFSVKSKAAWNALPAEVRADIVKREAEIQQGLGALKDYKDLKPWAELAASKGTTLTAALKSYVGIENLLKRDPAAGIARIAENCGLNQSQAAQLFATLAQKFGGGPQPDADDPVAQAVNPFLKPLMDKIAGLEGQLQSRAAAESQARMSSLDTALKTLEADPAFPFVHDLMEEMTFLLEHGRVRRTGNDLEDLKAAYDKAARQDDNVYPSYSEALIEKRLAETRASERKKEQEALAKAKNASRSVTASHLPGTVNARGNDSGGADDIEADVINAYRQVHSR